MPLLCATLSYADSTTVQPMAGIQPSSKIILASGKLKFGYNLGDKYPVESLTRACPMHLKPEVVTTITSIKPPPSSCSGGCYVVDTNINMSVDTSTKEIMSQGSYVLLYDVYTKGNIKEADIEANYVVTCV